MWILIWASVTAAGIVSSGAITFPTRDACETGKRSWGEIVVPLTEEQPSIPRINAKCIEAATGKAAPPPPPKP